MKSSEFHTHVTVLGWINIGLSAIFLFIGIFGFFFLTGMGLAATDPEATRILGFVGFAAAAFFVALAAPGVLAGYGLLTRQPWGRLLAMVVAVVDLFNIPIGTAVGIYALWVLSEDQATDYFRAPAAA